MSLDWNDLINAGLGFISGADLIRRSEQNDIDKDRKARRSKLRRDIANDIWAQRLKERYQWEHWLKPEQMFDQYQIIDAEFEDA